MITHARSRRRPAISALAAGSPARLPATGREPVEARRFALPSAKNTSRNRRSSTRSGRRKVCPTRVGSPGTTFTDSWSHASTLYAALPKRVRAVAYSRRGRTIALADDANNTFLMDRESGEPERASGQAQAPACASAWCSHPTGATLASAVSRRQPARSIRIARSSSGTSRAASELEGNDRELRLCYQILFSPDGANAGDRRVGRRKPESAGALMEAFR